MSTKWSNLFGPPPLTPNSTKSCIILPCGNGGRKPQLDFFWEIHDATAAHLKAGRQGHAHPSFPIYLQYFRHKRWLIVYEPTREGMTVHRIVDAVRDLEDVFKEE